MAIPSLFHRIPLTLMLSALLLAACQPEQALQSALVSGPAPDTSGFARAEGPQPFEFPQDLGPHPGYQTEWWYYTGNLDTPDGRHFGYQLTFFRRALLPAPQRVDRPSDWAADQVYFAHFALTDVGGGEFFSFERFSRGAAGLAGAQAEPFQVWLEDWEVNQTAPNRYSLRASAGEIRIELDLEDTRGPVAQGIDGYSQKGPQPGNASYYYSQTRLVSNGEITIAGQVYPVSGLSWKDHEYSTSALSPGQVGWDWFSIQLSDGSDLMLFTLRRDDGTVDPFSSGNLIAPDGTSTPLSRDDFQVTVLDSWRSPHSGAEYPAEWRLELPAYGIELHLTPYLADQELRVSFVYWEGAVRVEGTRNGQPLTGSGYVELTGYYASMEGEF